MAGAHDNVLVLSGRGRTGKKQPAYVTAMRAAVRQLDELGCCLQELSPHLSWSAQRCMIASTPLRMRLTGARKRLDDLASSRFFGDQEGASWALELNDARLEADRRLQDIDECLHSLNCVGTSLAERVRRIEMFASYRSELLTVLSEIRHLITQCTVMELRDS
jgi:hypothetical protein